MTKKRARKILGKEAKNISDQELEQDIRSAELLKNLFFDAMIKIDDKPEYNLLSIT